MDLVLHGAAPAKERFEDVGLLVGRDSRSAIGDADVDRGFRVAAGSGCGEADPMAITRAIPGRVVEQVLERLFERHGVAHEPWTGPGRYASPGCSRPPGRPRGPNRPS